MSTSPPSVPAHGPSSRTLIAVREEPIGLDEAHAFVNIPDCGGLAFFVGCVRPDDTELGQVDSMDYEAYGGVAEAKMAEIADEACEKFGAERIVMLHRVGRLLPGEASVVVAAGCGHRAEAFSACRYVIDELKHRVPIWKRERMGDNGRWVKCDHSHGEGHDDSHSDGHTGHSHSAGPGDPAAGAPGAPA